MKAPDRQRDHDRRPDPEALLAEVLKKENPRGRLKIFLGYAPGVGKTYEMLEEALAARQRGVDVAIGIVETHGRPETQALASDLETTPRRQVPHRNVVLQEMDLDAIERRRPRLVLVDELAHTNAPGSRHERRYQDIQTLLDQNIDVYTTVNIQHLESLNDKVTEITGIHVRETVPDFVIDGADEISVVDIPIEQLHERLREGKVYVPDLAGTALDNFFKRGNLLALRELALRRVAGKLDHELINYMKARGIAGPWATSERLLVCVGASPFASRLVRKAFQMAADLKAEWYAVYVETSTHVALTQKERSDLADTLALAQELGAKVATLSGTDVGQEIVRFATNERVTKVILGRPRASFLRQLLFRSPVYELLRKSAGFDIYFIAPAADSPPEPGPGGVRGKRPRPVVWKNYALAALTILPVTAVAAVLFYGFHVQTLVVLFVLAPMASAFFFGIGPSLFVSALSAIVYDYLFTRPYFSLDVANAEIALEIVIFVLTSILTAQLARLVRRQQAALSMRLGQMEILSEMGKELLAIPNPGQIVVEAAGPVDEHVRRTLKFMKVTIQEGIAATALRYLDRALHLPCLVVLREARGKPRVWAGSDQELALTPKDQAIVEWVFTHDQPAGKGAGTLQASDFCFLPISSKGSCLGAIAIQFDFGMLLPHERALISAIANLAAVALENLDLQTSPSHGKPA
jgi:two-component system sensor histidine kinase KdpD